MTSRNGIKKKNARTKNTNESPDSPNTVEMIARKEKFFPFCAIFILLIMKAFTNEPIRKPNILAIVMRGVFPKTASNAVWCSQKGAAGSQMAIWNRITTKKFIAKPSRIIVFIFPYPHISVIVSLIKYFFLHLSLHLCQIHRFCRRLAIRIGKSLSYNFRKAIVY